MTDPTEPTRGEATPPGGAPSEDPTTPPAVPTAEAPTADRTEVPQSPPAQRSAPMALTPPPTPQPVVAASEAETATLGAVPPEEGSAKGGRGGKRFRWSAKTAIVAGVVAVALAAGVSGVVYAFTSSDGDSERRHDGRGDRHGKPDAVNEAHDGRYLSPMRAGFYGPLDALHGEFTVQGANGNYVVKFTQVGVVTEIDSDSLTVKSADGYTKTYAIDSETAQRSHPKSDSGDSEGIAGIEKDETVMVNATVSGDQATADSVVERGEARGGLTRPAPGGPDQLPLPREERRR